MPQPDLSLRSLGDEELVLRLKFLAAQERECVADVVEHLVELDRRELALDKGFPSLFAYCREMFGYSEAQCYLRIRAARAAAKFPRVLNDLREGRLHLDSITRLYPHLTQDNNEELLQRASGATKTEVLALTTGLENNPPVERDIVIPIAVTPTVAALTEVVPAPRHRFHFTADGELLALLERLRGLLRHKHPSGRFELIFKEAAEALLNRIDPDRRSAVRIRKSPALMHLLTRTKVGQAPPSTPSPAKRSRGVCAAIKREVWRRDEGRCAYVSPDGRRCGSREALEYDHILPWACGGRSDSAENIRLLCRTHNQSLARREFGDRRKDRSQRP